MEFKSENLKDLRKHLDGLAAAGNIQARQVQQSLSRAINEVNDVWNHLDDLPLSEWSEETEKAFFVIDGITRVLSSFAPSEEQKTTYQKSPAKTKITAE